ncbi:hypothetical protein [Metapseudomonas resinovorans]|uniref:hypothetical protein n=1 Tax=Metapseudomonas resinovorans TaxID=53412 RepID=UPI0012DBDC93|nr:hypothetical protein [Pseudomonas resinovorans]
MPALLVEPVADLFEDFVGVVAFDCVVVDGWVVADVAGAEVGRAVAAYGELGLPCYCPLAAFRFFSCGRFFSPLVRVWLSFLFLAIGFAGVFARLCWFFRGFVGLGVG